MDMEISFPGKSKVRASYGGFVIDTDQSVDSGGEGSAPAPFELFLASIGTCAGIYVLRFLQERGLSTEEAGITLHQDVDADGKRVNKLSLEIKLPPDFPSKYEKAVIRAADMCAVKKHIEDPPLFETYTTRS
ncbi:MAG: OsmC family protein [Thermoleophilia bacterium]|nr:OsmC family protein [Thermoleophilia bacterium]